MTFNSSGTFNVPPGVISLTVEAWGAGGNGGDSPDSSGATKGGGGGGGGAYSRSVLTAPFAPSYSLTVGAGLDSDFGAGLVIARKGTDGTIDAAGVGGTAAASVGTVKFSGGNGAFSNSANPGSGGGGSATTSANGGNGTAASGGTQGAGGTGQGAGGAGGANGLVGIAGGAPGGGGGGAGKGNLIAGGAGAAGRIVLTWVGLPEIDVKGNSVSIADGDVTPDVVDHTDFGSVTTAGAGNVVRTFTIINEGSDDLILSGPVTVTGTGFSLSAAPGLITIPAPGSTTFQVTFDPTTIGLSTGSVSFAHNDAGETPYNFSIQGTGTNSAPTDLALDNSSVAENAGANATVGNLSTTDADPGHGAAATYTFASGLGDTDNGLFNISGSTLRLNASANFEAQSFYSVRVQTDDNNGGTFAKSLTISITNANEMPSFTVGGNQSHNYGTSTVQTITSWATAIDDGDSTVTQGLSFTVTEVGSSGMFTTAPSVNGSGTLTYTPNGTAGTATFNITLTDDNTINGNPALTTLSQQFTITVTPPPQISVATLNAGDNDAEEGGVNNGLYTFSRDNTNGPLVVNFQLNAGSTATANTDFTLSGATTFNNGTGAGTITFPDTVATVTVSLTALTESTSTAEGPETARLDVAAGSLYVAGSPTNATVTISQNGFLVTTTADSGTGSLRQAILNANAIAGTDTITFSNGTGGTVNFTDASADIIDLATALPDLSTAMTISGTGADKITIRRPAASPLFRIFVVTGGSGVNLTGLTITGGNSNNNFGGGIRNNGTLTVSACNISGNTAGTGAGGGIENNFGRLTVLDSTISGNTAKRGGGINSTTSSPPFTAASTVTIVVNTTLSGNTVTGSDAHGGGFFNIIGLSYLVNCTVTGNTALAPSGSPLTTGGGGVASYGDALTETRFANTLVVGNAGSDVDFVFSSTNSNISLGGNLIGTGNSGANFPSQTTVAAANTILDTTLANNGGTTLTHALVTGSPARNAGVNANATNPTDAIFGDANDIALTTDQRGGTFQRAVGTVDVGAFELAFIPAEIVVEQPAGTSLTDAVSAVDFGLQNVAGQLPRTFVIKNIDTAGTLNLGAITIDNLDATGTPVPGATPGDFIITTAPASIVGPSNQTTLVVSFKPLQSGLRKAVLHIANDDPDENPFDIALSGTGTNFFTGSGPVTGTGGVVLTITGADFDSNRLHFTPTLGFVPGPGDTIKAVDMVTPGTDILNHFYDLLDGGIVALGFNGQIYYFTADYEGGDGNDLVLTNFVPATGPQWSWRSGPKARNNAGNFTSAPLHPGARQGGMYFKHPDGNLWIFGGYGYGTNVTNPPRWLNDLWEYNRNTGLWAHRGGATTQSQPGTYDQLGAFTAANQPGARHTGSTWVDNNGFFWLFGGFSSLGRHNDLWRYNPDTNQWAWMKGSSLVGQAADYTNANLSLRTPGARQAAASFYTLDGTLWLFGGFDGTNYLNDLWTYSTSGNNANNWTFISGSTGVNANGTYSGVPNTLTPGARRNSTAWVSGGKLYLFGGKGVGATGTAIGDLSDLWQYDPGTGLWTVITGDGTLNTPAGTVPGGRSAAGGWATVDGKLWLSGGFINGNIGPMRNDIWTLDLASPTPTWTFHSGSAGFDSPGQYGTLGTPGANNHPAARFTPSTFITLNGAQWTFGGGGMDGFGGRGRNSDLMRYGIEPPPGANPLPVPSPLPDELIVNEDPNASNATAGTMAYVPVSGQLSATDADQDIILFSPVGSTLSQGTLTLQANGQWTYTPAPGFVGQSTFQFRANDLYGGSSPVRTLTVTVVTNPADADNDGIADAYEQTHLGGTGADPLGDADADGQSNYFEYLAGTQPQDGKSYLTTAPSIAAGASGSGGAFKLELNHVRPGVNYHLETSTDLDMWTRIGTFTFSVSGSAIVEDPSPPTGQPQFYRMSLDTPVLLP